MKNTFALIFLFAVFGTLHATHNRAGEITYEHQTGYTYKVTITTYSRDSAPADRCELEIHWGDSSSSFLKRVNGTGSVPCGANNGSAAPGVLLGNDIRENVYTGTHTYPSSGTYIIYFEDPNRNAGIININQSVNVPFYVQSKLVIDAGLGGNSSPVLDKAPIDDGCVNQKFEHNAGAHDPNDDSLSYKLVPTRTSGGNPINTTYDPQYVQDSVTIDPVTGDLIWDAPRNPGQYNFAFQITEWRKIRNRYDSIGYVVRDLQVDIDQCPEGNKPPELQKVGPFCVEAGQELDFDIEATDPDGDTVTLTAFGGPYLVDSDPADPLVSTPSNPVTGNFTWNTTCEHVRKQPYFLSIEAKDDPSPRSTNLPQLVDIWTVEIRVVAPAPENPSAEHDEDHINLNWDQSICEEAESYLIYRREDTYGFVPSECETGVPAYTGYEFVDTVEGLTNTSYVDSSDLKRGVKYCYMVVAYFPDESESYASVEFCTALELTHPMMTNVDVLNTDADTGKIAVRWIYPPDLDSSFFPPPYSFRLFRAEGLNGTDFSEIQSLTDTFFVDSGLNTLDTAYNYKVEMYYDNSELLGEADPASSVYLEVNPGDQSNRLRFTHSTPWRNNSYVVYRESPTGSGNFQPIDTAFNTSYLDTGLENGEEYCYKALSIGAYTGNDSLPAPLLNNSQEKCAAPIDTSAPCAPIVSSEYFCEQDSLYLEWEYPADSACASDIAEYRVYYKPSQEDEFTSLYASIPAAQGNSISINELPVIGCYAVTAVDDAGNDPNGTSNESKISNIICAAPCPYINFPNVFTPNSDGSNDFFTAVDYKNIGDLQLEIFNRWGGLVYRTSSAEEFLRKGWDGRDMNSGRMCSDGVYYFVCRYTPESLGETQTQQAKGFLHLFGQN